MPRVCKRPSAELPASSQTRRRTSLSGTLSLPPSLAGDAYQCRAATLLAHVLTSAVQAQLPADVEDVPSALSPMDVQKVFERHVADVHSFVYRGSARKIIRFLGTAYNEGLQALRGSPLQQHIINLFRLVVHHGRDDKPHAAEYLREVAEAFTDCQAVQARVIERIGLRIRGTASDFRGLLTHILGDYKGLAIKMLAVERVQKLGIREDENPTHYENRLTLDLGSSLGLNAEDIRRAESDKHAEQRHPPLGEKEREKAATRARELFDLGACIQAIVAELKGFGAESQEGSLPLLFLKWADARLTEKHVVLDEEACTKVDITDAFALAVLEDVFLGRPQAHADETYREKALMSLFSTT